MLDDFYNENGLVSVNSVDKVNTDYACQKLGFVIRYVYRTSVRVPSLEREVMTLIDELLQARAEAQEAYDIKQLVHADMDDKWGDMACARAAMDKSYEILVDKRDNLRRRKADLKGYVGRHAAEINDLARKITELTERADDLTTTIRLVSQDESGSQYLSDLTKRLAIVHHELKLANRRHGKLINDRSSLETAEQTALKFVLKAEQRHQSLRETFLKLQQEHRQLHASFIGYKQQHEHHQARSQSLDKQIHDISRQNQRMIDRMIELVNLPMELARHAIYRFKEHDETHHVYYGGVGEPDGDGHGHIVCDKDLTSVIYLREPFVQRKRNLSA
ncbi:hypothetical protein B7Y94_01365 [Candidatus Saccharibacteria bacterium 32-49-12]|nr:MAG: hypothetical protein B7Y94_01365 [Candidatus Saccharibacteria bacterium 32-49-12]